MRKLLASAFVVAAFASAGVTALADNVGMPYYARGPRIIHVPQAGEELRDSQASPRGDAPEIVDEDEVTPVEAQRAVKPHVQVRSKAPPKVTVKTLAKPSAHQGPRRRPYSISTPEPPPPPPEPLGPRRALLSAPPPPLSDGPTPLRPTPRFSEPLPKPVASAPLAEPAASAAVDESDDHLPPPGDPRLAPPEPAQ